MYRLLLLVAVVGGCSSDADGRGADDVVGPFTGPTHRFVVESFTFPTSNEESKRLGDDLDGDGRGDNQFGMNASLLNSQGLLTLHSADIIAAGVIGSTVEIQADDLTTDATASVLYTGAEGTVSVPVGGRFEGGVFRSNRSRTTAVPGRATLHLPVFVEADPASIEMFGMQLDLEPDGQGGYLGFVRGGFRFADAMDAAYAGVSQMLRNNPAGHRFLRTEVDDDDDGIMTRAEFDRSRLFPALLAADIQLFDGEDEVAAVSAGFVVHLKPCAAGTCAVAPVNTCFDRIRDGGETDVDCGGAGCIACPGEATCQVPSDCQSNRCDAGTCAAPSCDDDVLNGFETAIDCGGVCATKCEIGFACLGDSDCASGACTADGGSVPGVCQAF